MKTLEEGITLDDFIEWYKGFFQLKTFISNLDTFTDNQYKLYHSAEILLWRFDNMAEIPSIADRAVEAQIDHQEAETERDQMIWFMENESDRYISTFYIDSEDLLKHSQIVFHCKYRSLAITIEGYEYVIDYIKKLNDFYDRMMEKYQPLPEHYASLTNEEIGFTLRHFLELHNKYPDLIEKYPDGH